MKVTAWQVLCPLAFGSQAPSGTLVITMGPQGASPVIPQGASLVVNLDVPFMVHIRAPLVVPPGATPVNPQDALPSGLP